MKALFKCAYDKIARYLCGKHINEQVYFVGMGDMLPAPLSREEESALIAKLKDGDTSARNALIERNLRLVVFIARRFDNTGVNIDDLVSIGAMGLVKAVNTFNSEKNIKLATYAARCIENEILMYLRRACKYKLEVSLDEPLNVDWDGNELLLSDVLGTDGDLVSKDLEDQSDKELLKKALLRLKPRERQIIELRYGLGGKKELTQKEVADMLGISQSYISRLEKRILGFLRSALSS